MGDKEECETIEDDNGNLMGSMMVMNANITDLRGKARQGLCVPI
jgi:hypothetical protein